MSQYIIDLSDNNSEFNWDNLNPDVIGVILKGTQSDNFKDKTFIPHLDDARAKDLYVGEYLYYNPTVSPQDHAALYFSRGLDFTHPKTFNPVIDFENGAWDAYVSTNKAQVEADLRTLVNLLKAGSGRSNVILYTYKGFWALTFGSTAFSDLELWVASYQSEEPGMFGGWRAYSIWQFSQRGSFASPNDGGDIDYSVVNADIALASLANIS